MNIKEKYNTSSAETKAAIWTAAIMIAVLGVVSLFVFTPQLMFLVILVALIAGVTYIVYMYVLSDIKYDERQKQFNERWKEYYERHKDES